MDQIQNSCVWQLLLDQFSDSGLATAGAAADTDDKRLRVVSRLEPNVVLRTVQSFG